VKELVSYVFSITWQVTSIFPKGTTNLHFQYLLVWYLVTEDWDGSAAFIFRLGKDWRIIIKRILIRQCDVDWT
jgi:hypothetical protein